MSHLIFAPLLVPLLTGILLGLLRGSATRLRRMLSGIATLALAGVALALVLQVADGTILVYRLGDWSPPFGIVLVADRLAAAMVMITAVLALCVLAHVVRSDGGTGRHFGTLFHFQLFGLNGAFLTGDLFNLFVFFEVLLIASYGLLLHGGGRHRTRAGLHYVVLNLIGSTLFLFAIGALYGVLGTLNMADLSMRVSEVRPADLGIVRAAALLLFVVFALKAALAPLHLWLPAAYGNTSAPVAALFAIMTKVGAYAILRVYTLIFGTTGGPLSGLVEPWLLPLGLVTILVGAIGAAASQRLAQLAGHLVIASAGTLLTAFGLGGATAVAAGLYYLVHTTFAAASLFLLADAVRQARGPYGDRLVAGPPLPGANVLGGMFIIIAVAIAGMPPLSGFLGKFMILQSSVGTPWMPWVLTVVLGTSLLIIVSLARSGSRLFFAVDPAAEVTTLPARPGDLLAPLALTVLGAALVVFAGPLHDFSRAAAEQLVQPNAYRASVLPDGREGLRP
jgi:multicomponent K+:H+ antiporter subunit D